MRKKVKPMEETTRMQEPNKGEEKPKKVKSLDVTDDGGAYETNAGVEIHSKRMMSISMSSGSSDEGVMEKLETKTKTETEGNTDGQIMDDVELVNHHERIQTVEFYGQQDTKGKDSTITEDRESLYEIKGKVDTIGGDIE